jgi:hypothetical protein
MSGFYEHDNEYLCVLKELDDLMTISFKGNIVPSGWLFILFRLVT